MRKWRAEAEAAPASSSESIKLNSSLTELKLHGDLRLRYQYDDRDVQANPEGVGVDNELNERGPSRRPTQPVAFPAPAECGLQSRAKTSLASSYRPRSRRIAETQLSRMASQITRSSSPRLILAGHPTSGLPSPPARSEPILHYGSGLGLDINPTGVAERVALHEIFPTLVGTSSAAGYSKDGKQVAAASTQEQPWELTCLSPGDHL